jgi:hypothetical protein
MANTRRLELTLDRPRLGWHPRPTVIFDGRGQPAQWGTGTWQVSSEHPTELTVFLYNRLWKYGQARIVVAPGDRMCLQYRAPLFFFGPGRLTSVPGL